MLKCLSCQSSKVSRLGKIPDTSMFSGVNRGRLTGGDLWQCSDCGLGFRYPRLSAEQMNAMYATTSDDAWRYEFNKRPDWNIARDWIKSYGEKPLDILDVGCADGHFLISGTDAIHRRCGVEINPKASAIAASAGIKIVGKTIEELSAVPGGLFDVITAFDVLEHVADPRLFIAQSMRLLRKDGHLIIATGNLAAPTFRFMGSRYWYAAIAEHVSFISPVWCDTTANYFGLQKSRCHMYSHASGIYIRSVRDVVANLIYHYFPYAFGWFRNKCRQKKLFDASGSIDLTPPSWATAHDHFITEFQCP